MDTLIIGQGIAGTILAEKLIREGESVQLIDHENPVAASQASSAVINPITGRRLVKTWLFDALDQSARKYYGHLEGILKEQLIIEQGILRVFQSATEENDFTGKLSEEAFIPHLEELTDRSVIEQFNAPQGAGWISTAYKIEAQKIVAFFREKWKSEGRLVLDSFNHDDLESTGDGYSMGKQKYQRLVFCEGYEMVYNPFFDYLPIVPNKGEALIIKCPDLKSEKSIKKGITIVPLGEDKFWVGSTKLVKFEEPEASREGKFFLEEKLKALLKSDYEVVGQVSGIRPTSEDRRPLIGEHPNKKGLYCFNGFGSKGVSLLPYFADQFVNHLLRGEEIQREVNITRYEEKYFRSG